MSSGGCKAAGAAPYSCWTLGVTKEKACPFGTAPVYEEQECSEAAAAPTLPQPPQATPTGASPSDGPDGPDASPRLNLSTLSRLRRPQQLALRPGSTHEEHQLQLPTPACAV